MDLGMARVMDRLVTADLSRTYKPNPVFFKLMRVQLKLEQERELLGVSSDPATDLEPAAAQGYQTLWVDRTGQGSEIADLNAAAQLLW